MRSQEPEQSPEAHIFHHRTWLYSKRCPHPACCGSSWPQETSFSTVSSGLHLHHSWLGCSRCVCCMESLGGKSKTQTVGGNINRLLGSLVFTVPTCTFHRGCLCIAHCISPRGCCSVTFCTIVLAGFVLHAVLKKFPHYSLPFFFFSNIYLFLPSQSPEASTPVLGDLLFLHTACPSQPSVMCLLHGLTV